MGQTRPKSGEKHFLTENMYVYPVIFNFIDSEHILMVSLV